MKNRAIPAIFIIIGFFMTIGANSVYAFILKSVNIDSGFIPFGVVIFLSFIFSVSALNSLRKNRKNVVLGILLLVFCGFLGGIFYLAWDPTPETSTVVTVSNESGNVSNGTITPEEYVQYQ